MDKTAVRLVSAFDTIDELVFCWLMLTLPFGWQLSIIPNILFLVLIFRKVILEHSRPGREKMLFFAPFLLYLLANLISLIYAENAGRGGDMIFSRLNMFILPLGLTFVDFKPGLARRGMRFFILGTMIAVIVSLVLSLANSVILQDQMLCIAPFFEPAKNMIMDTDIHTNHFFGVNVSPFMHPAYFGLIICIAIIGLLNSYTNESQSWIIQKAGIPGFVFMSLMLVLLSTNGMIVSAIILIGYIFVFAALNKQKLDMFSSWLVVLGILLATGLYFNPQVQTVMGAEPATSLLARQKATEASVLIIKEHPVLGVGLGDLNSELIKVYTEKGYHDHAKSILNPHNQFLQSYASLGLLGIIALIWMFGVLIVYGIRYKSMMIIGFALVTISGFMFESMLNRYWGIITFSLFYSLMYYLPIEERVEDD